MRPEKKPNEEREWTAGLPLMVRHPAHSSSPGVTPSLGTMVALENTTRN